MVTSRHVGEVSSSVASAVNEENPGETEVLMHGDVSGGLPKSPISGRNRSRIANENHKEIPENAVILVPSDSAVVPRVVPSEAIDPHLQALIDAWPRLSEAQRAKVISVLK